MPFNPADLIPSSLNQNDLWSDFCLAVDIYFEDNVQDYIDQISSIRDIRVETDDVYKKLQLRQVGFVLDNSVLARFDSTDLSVFLQDFPRFNEFSGVGILEKIFRRVLKTDVDIVNLWTRDYTSFHSILPIGAITVDNGGLWFLSTHIKLVLNSSDILTLVPITKSINQVISEIFYTFAPINLVLKDIGANEEFTIEPQCICANLVSSVAIQYI